MTPPREPRTARRLLGAAWGAVRRVFPLSGLGVAVLALSSAAWFGLAVPRQDYVLQLVCLLALALLALALLLLFPAAVTLRLRRRRARAVPAPAERVVMEAVRGVGELMRVPARGGVPLVETGWTWTWPRGFDVEVVRVGDHLREQVRTRGRAWVEHVTRAWRVEDAFGLVKHELLETLPTPLTVLPWTGRLDLAPVMRVLASGEDLPHPAGAPVGDRSDMRRYGPGDPLRLVLWRVYARTRTLMVRTPERAVSPELRVGVFLVTGPRDEGASAAVRVAVESGVLGARWLVGADGVEDTASTVAEARAVICRSAGTDGQGTGLHAFVPRAAAAGMQQLLVVAPAGGGRWMEAARAAVRAWRGSVTVLLVADRVLPEVDKGQSRVRALVLRTDVEGPAPDWERLEDVMTTARAMEAAGASTVILERETGRVVHASTSVVARAA